ncbi:MAG: alpha/beta hydrolase [Betaproteobacteria bacterium]|nr:alpha/beta hydrolase [Betaproteobacteria bacterium]
MRRFLASVGRITIGVIVGVVIGNPVLLYFRQEKLLFYPVALNEGNRKIIKERYRHVEEVAIMAPDRTRLHGWFQRASGAGRAPLLIYFGGNAEDISPLPAAADRVSGWSMLMMNYRGYGLSEGAPGEKAMFADALLIHDTFVRREEVDAGSVAVMGRSLGSGVAVHLAAHRPIRALVLVTPFDSVASIAREKFWYAPTSLILKHPFDSLALAPKIDKPALFLVAAADSLVPLPHARRLFEAWAGPKQWQLVARENHDTIEFDPGYWRVIGEFLRSVSQPVADGRASPR